MKAGDGAYLVGEMRNNKRVCAANEFEGLAIRGKLVNFSEAH